MNRRKSGNIGIVVANGVLRAAQIVDGKTLTATVEADDALDNLKKSMRQLLTAAPFAGRNVVVGLEGDSVLVESLVVPGNQQKSVRGFCADRLKGDPLFDPSRSVYGVSVGAPPNAPGGGRGQTLAVLAAIEQARMQRVIQTCREMELVVQSVEAAPLAGWRAWTGQGMQARFLRTEIGDVVLAGHEENLLFCRVVPGAMELTELSTTLQRAAALLGAERFDHMEATGLSDADMQILSGDLGVTVTSPSDDMADPIAVGLATEGDATIDFTPPEERELRAKRRVKKLRIGMGGVAAALVVTAGIMGYQDEAGLQEQKIALERQVQLLRDTQKQAEELRKEFEIARANEQIIVSARPGHKMSTLFRVIANAAPQTMTFESIDVDDVDDKEGRAAIIAAARAKDKKVKIEDIDIPNKRLLEVRVIGSAPDAEAVHHYANALNQTGAFSKVRVESSERILVDGNEAERFRIHARAETR